MPTYLKEILKAVTVAVASAVVSLITKSQEHKRPPS